MNAHHQKTWRIGFVGLVAVTGVLSWGIGDVRFQSEIAAAEITAATADAGLATDELETLVSRALQQGSADSEAAIQELRKRGPDAVAFLMSQPELRKSSRWSAVLDAVAQQKDAQYSGLYWHTDLDQALAVAKREKKPVLSLRLLGKLTDELSCANSRFFRTTLYPNPAVRNLLSSQFVLHWQSVRAVPIVTIDFGDGRQIQRTITGNSLHLILDAQGRPIDVLPGLYASAAFVRELQQSGPAAVQMAGLEEGEFAQRRMEYHQNRLNSLHATWNDRCQQANLPASLPFGVDHPPEVWTKLASPVGPEPVIQNQAYRAVVEHAPPAPVAGRLSLLKSVTETPAMRLVRNVSHIINEDSVRNQYYLHVRIHNWFSAEHPVPAAEPLVERIYSELFLSPLNDPWYGLSQPDVYSAVRNDGRIHAVTQNSGH